MTDFLSTYNTNNTNNINDNDAWTISTLKVVTLCKEDIRQYSGFYHNENKFIKFHVPLRELNKDDYIKIFYQDIIEVDGSIIKIDEYDDHIILETNCRDRYGNGMYSGHFRLIIQKESITIQQKVTSVDTYESIRIIQPTYFE